MKLTPDELVAVATTMGLIAKHPPNDEAWDSAQRFGPHLLARLTSWLNEQL